MLTGACLINKISTHVLNGTTLLFILVLDRDPFVLVFQVFGVYFAHNQVLNMKKLDPQAIMLFFRVTLLLKKDIMF